MRNIMYAHAIPFMFAMFCCCGFIDCLCKRVTVHKNMNSYHFFLHIQQHCTAQHSTSDNKQHRRKNCKFTYWIKVYSRDVRRWTCDRYILRWEFNGKFSQHWIQPIGARVFATTFPRIYKWQNNSFNFIKYFFFANVRLHDKFLQFIFRLKSAKKKNDFIML